MVRPSIPLPYTFDAAQFRDAIRFAMQMGAPSDPARAPRFIRRGGGRTYWLGDVQQFPPPTGTLRVDRDGNPLNPEVEVRTQPDTEYRVDCAVEIQPVETDELPVGNFRNTKAVVTLLDQQYAEVEGVHEMVYNGDRYLFGYEPEINGLFDVDTHQLVFYALADT
jgi:hypothetical protein